MLCRAADAAGKAFYLIMDASRAQIEIMYRDWQAKRQVDFSSYGTILYREWGNEPPPELWQWITQRKTVS